MSDDIQRYRKILETTGIRPDLDRIASYIKRVTAPSNDSGLNVQFELPVNKHISTEEGLHISISEIEMAVRLYYRSPQGEPGIIAGPLFLWHDSSDDQHYGDEDDDEYNIEEWWIDQGNAVTIAQQYLSAAGFSDAAVETVDDYYYYNDNIEYSAPGVEKEIMLAVGKVLDEPFDRLMSKYGTAILATKINIPLDDIKYFKTMIIGYLLTDYKKHGATVRVIQIIDNLLTAGVDWPELAIIKRSIDSPN